MTAGSVMLLIALAGGAGVRFEAASAVKNEQELKAAVERPFADPWKVKVGRQGPERALTSCALLGLEFPGGTLLALDPADQRPLLHQRAHCRALLWLQEAKPARESFLGELPPDLATAGMLPQDLIPALGVPKKKKARVAAATRSWKQADPKLALDPSPPPPPGLHLRGRGYTAQLVVYGRGDFDGDGVEDILIRRDASPGAGSYREFGLFLLTRTAAGAPFKLLRSASEGH